MEILTLTAWWIATIGMSLMFLAYPFIMIATLIEAFRNKDWPTFFCYLIISLVLSAILFLLINDILSSPNHWQSLKEDLVKLGNNLGISGNK